MIAVLGAPARAEKEDARRNGARAGPQCGYLNISVLERCDDALDALLRNRPGHPHALLLHPTRILQSNLSEGAKLEEGTKEDRRESQAGMRAVGTCEELAEQTRATNVAPRMLRARQGGEAMNDCVLAVDPDEGAECGGEQRIPTAVPRSRALNSRVFEEEILLRGSPIQFSLNYYTSF